MKILIINTVCDRGSTGRISAGIARIAKQRGHEVWFAYGRGSHPDDIQGYKIGNRIDFICHVLLNFFRGKSGFGSKFVTKRFLKWLDVIRPDVINIHNLHGFYIHVGMLFEYIKINNIPIIWTLHDCWSFTGQCAHFDYAGCDKWVNGCYNCPIFRTEYPYSLFCDNSRDNYIKKRKAFTGVENMIIVTPSKWLSDFVKHSFLKDYNVQVINNGIDTNRFSVISDNNGKLDELKRIHRISKENKIILGVANVWTDRKGLKSFYSLANILPDEYVIVLVGVTGKALARIKSKYSGRIIGIRHTESIDELVCWYNLASVFVNPTLEDTFPTTNIEALACGTPVITYNTGGSPETISDECGVVVNKEDVTGLAEEIKRLSSIRPKMSEKCRLWASQRFNTTERLGQYVDLIENIRR